MEFIAFLVVNAMLFLRPGEIVQELERAQLYYFSMLVCLAFSIPSLMRLAFCGSLIKHPTVILSYLMLFIAMVSLAVNLEFVDAALEEIEFVKIFVYFTLFLAIIRTPTRLKGVIACVSLCMMATALIGILHYYDAISINLKIQEELVENPLTATVEIVRRLRFTGILHDPNEVAVFLSMLTFLCAYQLTDKKAGVARYLWLLPIAVFLFSIFLTRSRGGLLSLLTGMTVFALYGFRPKDVGSAILGGGRRGRVPVKGFFFLAVSVPVLLVAAGSRQTDISSQTGTMQTRFGLWSDWLQEFRQNPVVGVGPKIISQEAAPDAVVSYEPTKHCAHNSYLQPFADMGFLGGLCFLGAVGAALITVHRYGFDKAIFYDADLARLQPYMMAALGCSALGFLTLTLNYVLPTFFILALPVAYYGMTACYPPIERPSLSVESLVRLGFAGVCFLAFTYVTVLVMPKQ